MQAKEVQKNKGPAITPGSTIVISYKLLLADGSMVDEADKNDPLHFTLGDGTFPAGVEPMFYGMHVGDIDTRTFGPEQGWGHPDPGNIQTMLESDFPDHDLLKPGKVIEFRLPNNDALPGTVLEIDGDQVKVDFNPPLAGREVTVEVCILAVQPGNTND